MLDPIQNEEQPLVAIPPESVDNAFARDIALTAALRGIVLLENDGILPLKNVKTMTVAFVGPNCNATQDMLSAPQ
jgi:beta-D-xylosidase 4